MAGLLGAYSGLSNMSRSSGLGQRQNMMNLNKEVNIEREEEEEKRRKRESAGGIGRLVGGVGGGLLATLLSGGAASPLLIGALTGVGSTAGRAIGSNQRKVGTGRFDIAQDEESNRLYKDSMMATGLQDALTAFALSSTPGLLDMFKGSGAANGISQAASNANYYNPVAQESFYKSFPLLGI